MIERDEPSPLQKDLQKWMPKNIGPDMRGAGPELVLGRAIIKDYSDSRVLDRLMLYERRIENSLQKAMRELEKRQIIRQYKQQEADQKQSIPIPINDNRDEAATQKSNQSRLAPSTAGGLITDLKKQNQSRPSAGNLCHRYSKSEYLNPKRVNEDTVLKKQSQLPVAHIGATPFVKRDYDKTTLRGAQENKPNLSLRNQNQLQAYVLAKDAEKSDKPPIASTG
jgi:hypothetical protein